MFVELDNECVCRVARCLGREPSFGAAGWPHLWCPSNVLSWYAVIDACQRRRGEKGKEGGVDRRRGGSKTVKIPREDVVKKIAD